MLKRKGGLYRNGGIPVRQCSFLSKLDLPLYVIHVTYSCVRRHINPLLSALRFDC
jgi:hypothetical protein